MTPSPSTTPMRVLLIGMADSIHIARWIQQFSSGEVNFTLFPSGPHRSIHPRILEMEAETGGALVHVEPRGLRRMAILPYAFDRILGNRIRGRMLRRLIVKETFDLLHIQEIQHAGYLALSITGIESSAPVLVSNWGSDIFWFQQFPRHRVKIQKVLSLASHYSAECQRDINIAQQLGFSGFAFPPSPNAGGVKVDSERVPGEMPSKRRMILVKGYTGFVGQAITALRALREIHDDLRDFEVVVYSASRKSKAYAYFLRMRYRISITSFGAGLPHDEMLGMFRRARVYVGISSSDGISTSLLEAMSQGCFPIQTNTSCADEWLGAMSGFRPDDGDIKQIAMMLQTALRDDALVDRAAIHNSRVIYERAREDVLTARARQTYKAILGT